MWSRSHRVCQLPTSTDAHTDTSVKSIPRQFVTSQSISADKVAQACYSLRGNDTRGKIHTAHCCVTHCNSPAQSRARKGATLRASRGCFCSNHRKRTPLWWRVRVRALPPWRHVYVTCQCFVICTNWNVIILRAWGEMLNNLSAHPERDASVKTDMCDIEDGTEGSIATCWGKDGHHTEGGFIFHFCHQPRLLLII